MGLGKGNGRGGARQGAGRPRGPEDLTLRKLALRKRLLDRLEARIDDYVDALETLALGSKYLMYRDEKGRYITVTARQAKRYKELNLSRLELWDRPPNADALKQVFDRLVDPPKASVEHSGSVGLTLEQLVSGTVSPDDPGSGDPQK